MIDGTRGMSLLVRGRGIGLGAALCLVLAVALSGDGLPADRSSVRSAFHPLPPVAALDFHVPILMYHRVVPLAQAGKHAAGMVMSPEVFDRQLAVLARAGWKTITLESLAEAMHKGVRPPPRTFVITIDDGWADGYRYALPVLRKYGYVATYFVIAGRIGHRGYLSVAQLRELQAAGDEIGNHTESHTSLRRVLLSRANIEVAGASDHLERLLGRRPVSFSYPTGATSPAAFAAVESCPGLEIAVTTEHGIVSTWATRYALPRVAMDTATDPTVLLRTFR
jgi:peptidoglycan/xylan/chitin deacetylase (PgdA/CDA1 family)